MQAMCSTFPVSDLPGVSDHLVVVLIDEMGDLLTLMRSERGKPRRLTFASAPANEVTGGILLLRFSSFLLTFCSTRILLCIMLQESCRLGLLMC